MTPGDVKAPLSVAIITKDEEDNLPLCLKSVAFAAQIVVVDSGSGDDTVEIARDFGCDVYEEPWRGGFGAQKQFAIDQCRQPWILVLDADERLPAATAAAIAGIVAGGETAASIGRGGHGGHEERLPEKTQDDRSGGGEGQRRRFLPSETTSGDGGDYPGPARRPGGEGSGLPVGYSFPRKNYFQGRWIRHAGWWPDRLIRLFRRGYGRMSAASVHEGVEVAGPVVALEFPIEHYTESDLGLILRKIDRYSTLGAREAHAAGRRATVAGAVGRAGLTFLQGYLLRGGFLDGPPG
ncbi:MAG: glycosyltransferase family 2 protein, partial [Pseudomonadota bacterium]|nr:glycosyltransferase family 2 protein [Pseudomonadota bacterium]